MEKLITKDIEFNGIIYDVDITLTAKEVNASFSHGFGVESRTELDDFECEIESVFNQDGEPINNREIIKGIERNIDPQEYSNEL